MNIEEEKRKFFSNVLEFRKQQEITLEELGERSGIPLEMLNQLEQNTLPVEMMVDDAFALARVFGCEVHELFE